jgi:hypothetical protein
MARATKRKRLTLSTFGRATKHSVWILHPQEAVFVIPFQRARAVPP